eukprot:CAMPEP_0184550318 /NCGR_PEP_ID=MMETSP0199_2-20130426/19120_1 /TAXON_ID=1112570 /ORGANISM="Thraustochytrium sp., Strain LLF1b" /LENGTH=386 /DNA_ID=CAMNT_0026945167 /DNA_START=367 /DNA_END=1524 /DNA_ORIENTATION=-
MEAKTTQAAGGGGQQMTREERLLEWKRQKALKQGGDGATKPFTAPTVSRRKRVPIDSENATVARGKSASKGVDSRRKRPSMPLGCITNAQVHHELKIRKEIAPHKVKRISGTKPQHLPPQASLPVNRTGPCKVPPIESRKILEKSHTNKRRESKSAHELMRDLSQESGSRRLIHLAEKAVSAALEPKEVQVSDAASQYEEESTIRTCIGTQTSQDLTDQESQTCLQDISAQCLSVPSTENDIRPVTKTIGTQAQYTQTEPEMSHQSTQATIAPTRQSATATTQTSVQETIHTGAQTSAAVCVSRGMQTSPTSSSVSEVQQFNALTFAYEVLLQKLKQSEHQRNLLKNELATSQEKFTKEVRELYESCSGALITSEKRIKELEKELA